MVYLSHSSEVKFLALRALADGKTMDAVCYDYNVSERSIKRWKHQLEEEKSFIGTRKAAGRPRAIPNFLLIEIQRLLDESPSLYLDEIADYLAVMHEHQVNIATLARSLKDISYERKVMRTFAAQRDDQYRHNWLHWVITEFKAWHLVFVDESSKDGRTLARRYGRAMKGMSPEEVFNYDRGERWSILPALAVDGYLKLRVVEGSVDGSEFADFIINDVVRLRTGKLILASLIWTLLAACHE